VPGIPPYVDALVARATARDRELRPADARVLLHQVRRVRAALDHGIADDPDLTADLTPTVPVHVFDSIDYVVEDTPTIVEPGQVLTRRRGEDVSRGPTPADGGGPTGRRRWRRGPTLLALALVVAVLAGAGWWFEVARYTTTPGVVDLTAAQARSKLAASGLTFEIDGQSYSETVPAGSVVSTQPQGGARVLKDGTVLVVVSKRPERYPVPRLRGKTLDQASQALIDAHIAAGRVVRRYDDKVPKGVVLASSPKAGGPLRRNTKVDLVVSRGPRPLRIADWTGRDAADAKQALQKQGFEVRTRLVNDDSAAKGTVMSQTPSSGTGVPGDQVRLVVSKGPVLVAVPKVTGMGIGAATRTLEGAGFDVATSHTALYVGLGFVVRQTPGSGDLAPRGSTVTLSLV